MGIIREGVRVEHFFRPFRGSFKGSAYDSDIPPPVVINNSATCAMFSQFISDTIIQWVTAGIAVWGPVDLVAPPYLVLPFADHLCDIPRYVLPHHFQTTFDDKNGFKWQSFYFVFRTLPFGWMASAFIYHKFGLVVSDAAWSIGFPVS